MSGAWHSMHSLGIPPWSALLFIETVCTWCGRMAMSGWRPRNSGRPHWLAISTHTRYECDSSRRAASAPTPPPCELQHQNADDASDERERQMGAGYGGEQPDVCGDQHE